MPEPSRGLVSALAVMVLLAATAGSVVVAEVRRGIESDAPEVGPPVYQLSGEESQAGHTWTADPATNATSAPTPGENGTVGAPAGQANGTVTSSAPSPSPSPRPSPSPAPQPRHRTRSS